MTRQAARAKYWWSRFATGAVRPGRSLALWLVTDDLVIFVQYVPFREAITMSLVFNAS